MIAIWQFDKFPNFLIPLKGNFPKAAQFYQNNYVEESIKSLPFHTIPCSFFRHFLFTQAPCFFPK